MAEKERKYLFVLNPISGGKRKEQVPDQIIRFCKESECLYRIFETTGRNDHEKLRQVFEESEPQAIIAIGGDGTVNLVGRLLVNTDVPMGIIPLGSANGLAKDLGIPLGIREAFEVIRKFRPKAIDTLKINDHHCFHLSDFGFNARVCHRFAESLFRGRISYLWYGFIEFFRYKYFPYMVKTRLDTYEGQAFMMIITNANKFGTNVSINPLGKIDDGYFEISILKPFPRIISPYIFYHLTNNSIYRTPYYKVIRSKEAVIHNRLKEYFHIDGEPIELEEEVRVEINARALKVLLP